MNERINELLDEARLTVVQEMYEPELYNFPELIVREVFETIEDEGFKVPRSVEKRVKQHYGVEE